MIDEIVSTPGHKYYLPDNSQNRNPHETLEHASYQTLNEKWVSACDLKQGDRVLLANADPSTNKPKYGTVISIKTEDCEPFTTYNFEVADFHTYYVGEQSVLVHNACPTSPKRLSKSEIKKFDAELYKEGYVGNKGARFDIFKDTAKNSKIWLGDKPQKIWIETFEFLQDLHKGNW